MKKATYDEIKLYVVQRILESLGKGQDLDSAAAMIIQVVTTWSQDPRKPGEDS